MLYHPHCMLKSYSIRKFNFFTSTKNSAITVLKSSKELCVAHKHTHDVLTGHSGFHSCSSVASPKTRLKTSKETCISTLFISQERIQRSCNQLVSAHWLPASLVTPGKMLLSSLRQSRLEEGSSQSVHGESGGPKLRSRTTARYTESHHRVTHNVTDENS